MGIKVRQRKEKLAIGDKSWYVFANFRGKRFSMCAGSKSDALEIQKQWQETLTKYKARETIEAFLKKLSQTRLK